MPDPVLKPEDPTGLTPDEVGAWLRRAIRDNAAALASDLDFADRQKKHALRSLDFVHRELPAFIDPHDLSKTGWGVIYPAGKRPHLHARLRPLIARRTEQAGKLFRTFTRRKGESGVRFLRRHGETFGTIRPGKVPYYLLIVASPEEIPFEFQYHLSLSHAVGRIWFEKPADFKSYAEAVRDAETKGVGLPRQAAIFSVENDSTTRVLGKYLVRPLHLSLKEGFPDWKIAPRRHGLATQERLRRLLGGGETPGLLLVSSHGRRIDPGYPDVQRRLQGALMCPRKGESDSEPFTAEDLAPEAADLHGLIGIFFCCYGAGTPTLDNFPHEREGLGPEAALATEPHLLSRKPFLASLPVELLRRGALAIVGHIDRGWTTSCVWTHGRQSVNTTYSLEDSLGLLLRGHRLGHALRPLNRRYSQMASRLAQMINLQRVGAEPDLAELGFYWTAVNDARNLIVLGDPAVYLLGRRGSETTIRLDPELLRRIERKVGRLKRIDVETWIHKVLARHV